MKIHACLMTQNELTDLAANVHELLKWHFISSVTVVDGGSLDLTIPYMRNLAQHVDHRVRFFIHPWKDNFPEQRNNYLRHVGEIAVDGDWILAMDPDEFVDEHALHQLEALAHVCENKPEHYRRVAFRCRSVSMHGARRAWTNEDDFWKGLYFRWSPELRYGHPGEMPVHEHLHGADPIYETGRHPEFPTLFYEHRKQENVIWVRGARNLFCGGGGDNVGQQNPRWVELREISSRLGIRTWHEMQAYLLGGNIDGALRDWMLRNRHESGYPGASEHREFYKTYFRWYHPEEEPAELRNEHIE